MKKAIDEFHHTEVIDIDAPPERVWALVADVTRTGERSPIVRRVEWLDGYDRPAVGARFRGWNRTWYWRWTRECVITECDSGRVFAFSTSYNGTEHTRWRYELEPTGAGTRATESYESLAMPWLMRLLATGPHLRRAGLRRNARGMRVTLERLKAEAESSAS